MAENKDNRTVGVTNGIADDAAFGAVTPPLYLSSNYAFREFEATQQYEYSRTSNPTRDILGDTIAKLEGGADAVVTSSGMAALHLVLSSLKVWDHVVAPHDCYGGTHRLLTSLRDKGQLVLDLVDQNDHNALRSVLGKNPALVMVETPSNPLMRVVDIRAIAQLAREAGAKLAVDNTFLSPALQQPIALGADFVVHSTTKYLNGHSDVVGGVVVSASPDDGERLKAWSNLIGVTGSPFDSYLTLRGVRTLFARIECQQRTAGLIASMLSARKEVSRVYYPGLPSDPGHALASKQQKGFGAMLSFELDGGIEAVRKFVRSLKIITLAESLGGIESLIAHPATMTHASMGPQARQVAGIQDGLLRMSVGLEAEVDLLGELVECLDDI